MGDLKFMREDAGMTQAELAEASGVNVRLIQHYEQGFKDINRASVITVLKLAEALNCDVYDVINPRGAGDCIPAWTKKGKKKK